MTSISEKIKSFWNERANQYLNDPAATTDDVYIRELEIATIIQTFSEICMTKNKNVLDVGCGNGYSTLRIAQAFPELHFLGIDYSKNMIKAACDRLESHSDLKNRVKFIVGDITELEKACHDSVYDVIITDRCLINLDSFEAQSYAIAQISQHIITDGFYIAIENFIEGHENMNSARNDVELPEIPVRWHNLYFKEEKFLEIVKRFFNVTALKDFSSSYYFATRVIYSKMCQMRGEEPDYKHEIHQLAVKLPWIGNFSPLRMAVLQKK